MGLLRVGRGSKEGKGIQAQEVSLKQGWGYGGTYNKYFPEMLFLTYFLSTVNPFTHFSILVKTDLTLSKGKNKHELQIARWTLLTLEVDFTTIPISFAHSSSSVFTIYCSALEDNDLNKMDADFKH